MRTNKVRGGFLYLPYSASQHFRVINTPGVVDDWTLDFLLDLIVKVTASDGDDSLASCRLDQFTGYMCTLLLRNPT